MRNRYITALLVVLAATGVEAQTFQSVLKLALGEVSVEEIISQPEIKGLESDILSVIKSLKTLDRKSDRNHSDFKTYHLATQNVSFCTIKRIISPCKTYRFAKRENPAQGGSICIRAPSVGILIR